MGGKESHIPVDIGSIPNDEKLKAKECWDFMCHGCKLLKITGSKENHQTMEGKKKYFVLDEDLMGFRYSPTRKPKGFKVPLEKLKAVLYNGQIRADEKLVHYHKDCQFIVEFEMDGEIKHMHLVSYSIDVAKKWLYGLESLIKRRGLLLSKPDPLRDGWLKSAFDAHDKDNNGALSLSEVQKLLISLNITLDPKQLKQLFNDANTEGIQGSKDGCLTREEFADFFKQISTREEIVSIMKRFSESSTSMTTDEFRNFLTDKQGMVNVTDHDCKEFIRRYEMVTQLKQKNLLGIDGLTAFLKSKHGDIFNNTHDSVYHDMTQPLTHYFIASSHNTYLMMDQVTGPSSTEAYINAFKKGMKCVELDCWDGDNNEPVIYHGHTLTSKILFKDVIQVVKEYGFIVSPYPVVLSLENHCSVEQQKVMAKHALDILGDQLCFDPFDSETLPGPESLKMRFLIKGKKLLREQEEGGDHGDVSEDDEAAEVEHEGHLRKSSDPAVVSSDRKDSASETTGNADIRKESISEVVRDRDSKGAEEREEQRKKKEGRKPRNSSAMRKSSIRRSFSWDRESKGKKLKLAIELSRLVSYFQSVKFRSFESYENNKLCSNSSFGEAKFSSLAETHGEDFAQHTKRYIVRTYPAGKRVDSSNYNPQDAWNCGCQIVALNCQTDGPMMDIYLGKFRDNGKAGYLLKPQIMRDTSTRFNPNQQEPFEGISRKSVVIKIISGQQFPKPKNSSKKDVVDPYISVDIFGIPQDRNEKSFTTKTVANNGFNPVWNETFVFHLSMPELAMIRFSVYDADQYGSDDFIGQFSLPFTSVRPGYRHIHLLRKDGEPLPNSSIFVYIGIDKSD